MRTIEFGDDGQLAVGRGGLWQAERQAIVRACGVSKPPAISLKGVRFKLAMEKEIMRAPRCDAEAFARAAKVSHRSSSHEVSTLLEFAGAGTLVPALLHRHGLQPVYTWMRAGIEFDTIFRAVWVYARSSGTFASVKSWGMFAEAVRARHSSDFDRPE